MIPTTENTIHRTLVIKAPLDKVWNAIATPEGFNAWFCTRIEGEWKEGETVTLIWPGEKGNEIVLTSIQPQTVFSYQWHPGDYNRLADHPTAELTTITMRLRPLADGTELDLIETGFENIPEERRLRVLGLNTEGWDEELENVRKYLES